MRAIAMRREWGSWAVATTAAVAVFAAYCQLHGLIANAVIDVDVSLRWGFAAGAPSGLLAWGLWCSRARLSAMTRRGSVHAAGIAIALFLAIAAGGSALHLLQGGASSAPDLWGAIVRKTFQLVPLSIVVTAATLALLRFVPPARKPAPRPAGDTPTPAIGTWLQLPEAPKLHLRIADITHIEAAGNYCELHCGGKVHLVRIAMRQLATRLAPAGFVQVHRSTLVNAARLRSLQPDPTRGRIMAHLDTGRAFPVGSCYRDGAKVALSQFGCASLAKD